VSIVTATPLVVTNIKTRTTIIENTSLLIAMMTKCGKIYVGKSQFAYPHGIFKFEVFEVYISSDIYSEASYLKCTI